MTAHGETVRFGGDGVEAAAWTWCAYEDPSFQGRNAIHRRGCEVDPEVARPTIQLRRERRQVRSFRGIRRERFQLRPKLAVLFAQPRHLGPNLRRRGTGGWADPTQGCGKSAAVEAPPGPVDGADPALGTGCAYVDPGSPWASSGRPARRARYSRVGGPVALVATRAPWRRGRACDLAG